MYTAKMLCATLGLPWLHWPGPCFLPSALIVPLWTQPIDSAIRLSMPSYQITSVKLNINEFEEWLKSYDSAAVVGFTSGISNTPLARFLAEKATTEVAYINYAVYGIPGDGIEATTVWAHNFLEYCAELEVKSQHPQEITAWVALKLLQRSRR